MKSCMYSALCGLLLLLTACSISRRSSVEGADELPPLSISPDRTRGSGDSTTPPRGEYEGEADEGASAIGRLLEGLPLRLSTDATTRATRFHFTAHVAGRTLRGERHASDILVVRDNDATGILVSSTDGLPYCYMSAGMSLMVDRANPGGLIIISREGRRLLGCGGTSRPNARISFSLIDRNRRDHPCCWTWTRCYGRRSPPFEARHWTSSEGGLTCARSTEAPESRCERMVITRHYRSPTLPSSTPGPTRCSRCSMSG